MSILDWDIRSIALWQDKTFHPTARGQRLKSRSEALEYFAAVKAEEKTEELVDFYISLCWLAYIRKDPVAMLILLLIEQLPYAAKIKTGVNKKMQINLGRKWYKTHTGEWRHIDE